MKMLIVWLLIGLANIFPHNLAQNDDNDVIDLSNFGPGIFGKPIENYGKSFDQMSGNPEEQGPYLEGDLLIPSSARNGMKSESLRWKNGEVPFEIHGAFSELRGFALIE